MTVHRLGGPVRLDSANQPDTPALDPLLTAVEVGRILGVRPKRVYELGIPAIRISEKSLRWSRGDLQAWIHQRRGAA
jgi:predicted DNA-binding transcriptional regulator AlpA